MPARADAPAKRLLARPHGSGLHALNSSPTSSSLSSPPPRPRPSRHASPRAMLARQSRVKRRVADPHHRIARSRRSDEFEPIAPGKGQFNASCGVHPLQAIRVRKTGHSPMRLTGTVGSCPIFRLAGPNLDETRDVPPVGQRQPAKREAGRLRLGHPGSPLRPPVQALARDRDDGPDHGRQGVDLSTTAPSRSVIGV
jgi:hypothetical protein